MDEASPIAQLLHQWRRLTAGEERGILSDDWPRVHDHQAAKTRLRPQITQALHQFRAGRRHPVPEGEIEEQRLSRMVEDLVARERANGAAIRAKMERNRAEFNRNLQIVQSMRGMRRAYGAPQPQLWHSYS
jgi:hypothetical protein